MAIFSESRLSEINYSSNYRREVYCLRFFIDNCTLIQSEVAISASENLTTNVPIEYKYNWCGHFAEH